MLDHRISAAGLSLAPDARMGGIPLNRVCRIVRLLLLLPLSGGTMLERHLPLIWLLPAAGLIFATGLIDDLIGLEPWQSFERPGRGSALWGGVRCEIRNSL
jgi:hypothetical protein